MRSITYIELDYNEVDELIKINYNLEDYDCVGYEEWCNDSKHSFDVESKPLKKYTKNQLEDKDYSFILDDLLNDLCSKNLIDSGKYLVNVCW